MRRREFNDAFVSRNDARLLAAIGASKSPFEDDEDEEADEDEVVFQDIDFVALLAEIEGARQTSGDVESEDEDDGEADGWEIGSGLSSNLSVEWDRRFSGFRLNG